MEIKGKMVRPTVRPMNDADIRDDVYHIIKVCLERGYIIDPVTAEWAWREFSRDGCGTGWLWLIEFSEDEIYQTMLQYTEQRPL